MGKLYQSLFVAGTLVLAGCGAKEQWHGQTEEGYSYEVAKGGALDINQVWVYDKGKNPGNVSGVDLNRDGRIDRIHLNGVAKDSEIEKLATVERLSALIAKHPEQSQ